MPPGLELLRMGIEREHCKHEHAFYILIHRSSSQVQWFFLFSLDWYVRTVVIVLQSTNSVI